MRNYAVVIHEDPEGGFWGEVPALPGCYSQRETLDELKQNIREAIAGVVEVLREQGREPDPNIQIPDIGRWRLKRITGSEMSRLIEVNGWSLRRITPAYEGKPSYLLQTRRAKGHLDSRTWEQEPKAGARAANRT